MTFVTGSQLRRDNSESEESGRREREQKVQSYSGESISASNAFRFKIVTVRPSI